MGLSSSSTSSRNCWPFRLDACNVIFQLQIVLLHSLFLLKSYKSLPGSNGIWQRSLVSLSTALKRGQSQWLEYSQNLIELFILAMKNFSSSLEIAANCNWYRWVIESKIFFTAWIESVMTMIFEIPSKLTAWLMPHLMANSSALVEVTLVVWWIVLIMGLSWTWIYAIEVVTLFLIPTSEMIRVCE